MKKILFVLPGLIVFISLHATAQSPFKGVESLFTTPCNYVVHHVNTPPGIDGDISDAVWQQATWTSEFQDIEGDSKPRPFFKTQVKMLWDDSCLYIAAKMQEPHVWANERKHDAIVFHDNDFELFVSTTNSTQSYFEIEVNALNTIFDLFLNKPYRDGGRALFNWNAEGLRSAIKVQGTLNDPSDTDKGWTVEMAIPFRAVTIGNFVRVPKDGTLWRINFSRVEWDTNIINGKYVKVKDPNGRPKPEHNWVWSAQGAADMHLPERWGYLQFAKSDNAAFTMPYNEKQRQYLWLIFYLEELWHIQHPAYMLTLKELGLSDKVIIDNKINKLELEATDNQFMGLITDEQDKVTWIINQEGTVRRLIFKPDE